MTEITETGTAVSKYNHAFAKSAEYDEWTITDFQTREFDKELASFLLTTIHAELFVGVAFVNFHDVIDLEVSVVEYLGEGERRKLHRKPLSYIAREFAVLTQYSAVGIIIVKFMEAAITWGQFKIAVSEIIEGEAL